MSTTRGNARQDILDTALRLFAENGISIAFNQLEVWLHREDGEERKVKSVSPKSSRVSRHPPPGAGGDPGDIDIGGSDGGDGGR